MKSFLGSSLPDASRHGCQLLLEGPGVAQLEVAQIGASLSSSSHAAEAHYNRHEFFRSPDTRVAHNCASLTLQAGLPFCHLWEIWAMCAFRHSSLNRPLALSLGSCLFLRRLLEEPVSQQGPGATCVPATWVPNCLSSVTVLFADASRLILRPYECVQWSIAASACLCRSLKGSPSGHAYIRMSLFILW